MSNGEHLLNFLIEHDLFTSNTAFPHKCRHITTWTGSVKDHSRRCNYTIPLYTQIDYVVYRRRSKNVLQDGRSYAGAKLCSDHKIAVARLDLSKPYMIHRRNQTRTQFDVSHLTCNRNTQLKYQQKLNSKLCTEDLDATIGPTSKFESLLSVIKSTATEIVGTRKPHQRANY